ncbi:hypothetical protein [Ideonella sp.]|jgi:hypothetical protein|uniref:hypothetical protein n=1 Tax=Ideonella sp. TaxID=1929293 RepID=UPI0037C06342
MTTQTPKPLEMATYYVVPVRSGGDKHAQHCRYFNPKGEPVSADQLNCHAHGYSNDFVCLAQPTADQLANWLNIPEGIDTEAELFAAVAKTLGGSYQLPNMFMARERRVVVPVADNSERGLLLIFAHGGSDHPGYLTASTDPIIRNTP